MCKHFYFFFIITFLLVSFCRLGKLGRKWIICTDKSCQYLQKSVQQGSFQALNVVIFFQMLHFSLIKHCLMLLLLLLLEDDDDVLWVLVNEECST